MVKRERIYERSFVLKKWMITSRATNPKSRINIISNMRRLVGEISNGIAKPLSRLSAPFANKDNPIMVQR